MKKQYSIHKNTYKHLDSMDPLRKFQKRFHKPKFNGIDKIIYLCGNSLGLQPIDTYDYVNKEINNWKNLGVDGHFSSERPWVTYHENLTNYTAEIVGSLHSEVVVMNSLSVNLHLLMISFYKPKNLKRKILIEQNSFPSDQFVVQSQLKYHNKDPKKDLRQVGILSASGKAFNFTGNKCFNWAGGKSGKNYTVQGNILKSKKVVEAMAKTFERSYGKAPLAERLISALKAGQQEGGDKRGMQSASLLIVKEGWGYGGNNDKFRDLRVDESNSPINELHRIYLKHCELFPRPEKYEIKK